MPLPKLSMQVFEAFEQVARHGSMQAAAREMGLSISTVSHHVARLEEELGATLLDRSARPFALTREGREALHHMSAGLQHLRRATSATAIGGVLGTRSLRIGIIEDFESTVTPELAVILAGHMPRAQLSISSVLSHRAPDLLGRAELDIAIVSDPDSRRGDIRTYPLARDPLVIVAPAEMKDGTDTLLQGGSNLPFLRFNPTHLIGRQIEAHLRRNRIDLPDRFAFDSVQSIMAIVANGDGWSIISPLGYVRAQRFAARVQLHPLALPGFARRITLMARSDFDAPTTQVIAALLRQSIRQSAVDPVCAALPWLQDSFTSADDPA